MTDTDKDNPLVLFVRAMARRQAKIDVRHARMAAAARRIHAEVGVTPELRAAWNDYQAAKRGDDK